MRNQLRIFQRFIGPALFVAVAQQLTADDLPFIGRPTISYEHTQPVPMRMPTDVAVAANGTVFIADGVNDRILAFDGAGTSIDTIMTVGDDQLSHPVGITVGPDGTLWIADTGNHRVLALRPDGTTLAPLIPQPISDKEPVDITDIAIDAAGKFAWLIDNDHHRLLRIDLTTTTQMQFGRYGESIGQFKYPFKLALDANDDLFVIEAVNARISAFSNAGNPRRAISTYGIAEGELYRPTGIAIDGTGLIWVADATLGAIQVFQTDGRFLGSLRDESGAVLRFDHCMGIDFDSDDHLYVTELGADRVRKIEITRGAQKPPRIKKADRRRSQLVGRQSRGCTICHIEWFEGYADANTPTLAQPLDEIPDEPIVSRSKTCLSCHDGSVGDSRKRVWQQHGHLTDIVPPMNMKVPDQLPLVQGMIKCRTCHSAHTSGQFNANIEEAVFLRVDNHAGGLCLSCHAEKARGPELGSHPTGGMPWPVPDDLIAAGAKVGPNPREITCVVCHTPHGSANDHLLVMPTESNQLCLSCHGQMRPGMFREGSHTEHPLFPIVNAEQKAAVERMGTRLGDGDKLICLSCHKLHHGKGKRFMLAEELTDGKMCLSCHSDKNSVVNTDHDLRTNRPEEKNRIGMTASTGGPCSSCHMFHRYARAPEPHPLDRLGQCITCHQTGRCAGDKTLGELNHQGATCLDCHDPHTTTFDHFMRDQPATLCSSCHAEQSQLFGGGHDVTNDQSAWPQSSAIMNDRCLACHRPHSTNAQNLMRVTPCDFGDSLGDSTCIACHTDADWDASSHVAAMHPRTGRALANDHGLPMLASNDAAQTTTISCRTCHNPHAPPSRAGSLLRVEPDAAATTLCLKCHTEMRSVDWTGHGSAALAHAGLDADACLPCHSVHANPALVDARHLWPKQWSDPAPASTANSAYRADSQCIACHQTGGTARPPAIASHPDVPIRQTSNPTDRGFLPLFDNDGVVSNSGKITCRTCHSPHGNIPTGSTGMLKTMSDAERRAVRLMLKPFEAPNVCTTCHGMDALRRFLYFHDSERRSGPLAVQSRLDDDASMQGSR